MFHMLSGTAKGVAFAVGINWKNLVIWKRERPSANTLLTPAICLTLTVNSKRAEIKNSLRNSAMRSLHFDDWADHIFTTVRLSQWNNRRLPLKSGAQRRQHKYTGNSSFHWIDFSRSVSGHGRETHGPLLNILKTFLGLLQQQLDHTNYDTYY